MTRTVALIILAMTLGGCMAMRIWFPYDPPPGAKPYPGKPTHYVMKGAPVPLVLDLGVLRYAYWPTAPDFQSFALCPLGKGPDVRCLRFYGGVKVDGTLTHEWRKNYGGASDDYVYEFKKEEQSAGGLHTVDETCTWENMGRC